MLADGRNRAPAEAPAPAQCTPHATPSNRTNLLILCAILYDMPPQGRDAGAVGVTADTGSIRGSFMHARHIHAIRGVLLAAFITLAAAAPASAAGGSFSLVTSSQSAGGQTVTLTAVIHNESTTQPLGSADLLPPASFQVTAALAPAAGSATLSSSCTVGTQTGPCVQLRDLALAPGQSVTVTMTVQTPACVPPGSSYAWAIEAKPANDFSSGPGDDLTLDPSTSSTTTTLDGACKLAFATQPHNVVVGQDITGTDWDPSGPPVTVQVLDVNGNVVPGSSAAVTVALANNPGAATLGGTRTVNADSGVASFGDLTVNQPAGGYTLSASSGSLTPATSTSFTSETTAAVCLLNMPCTTTAGNSAGNDKVTANAGAPGMLLESVNFDRGAPLACNDYPTTDPNTYTFFATVDRSKVATITIDNPATHLSGSPATVLARQQICFGASYEFTTAAGKPAAAGTLPDGIPGFIGLLPPCPAVGPCHDRKSDTTIPDASSPLGFDIVLVADIPSGLPGDPWER